MTAVVTNVANDLVANVATKRAGVDPVVFDEVIKRLEFTQRDSGCGLADIDVIVSNVLNNVTINILKRGDCDVVGVSAAVVDVLNNLHVNVASPSKRGEYSLEQLESIVSSTASNQGYNVPSGKRSDAEDSAAVNRILEQLSGNVKRSKASPYTVSQIASALAQVLNENQARDVTPEALLDALLGDAVLVKRADLVDAVVAVTNDLNNANVNVLTRGDVDVLAYVENVAEDATVNVLTRDEALN